MKTISLFVLIIPFLFACDGKVEDDFQSEYSITDDSFKALYAKELETFDRVVKVSKDSVLRLLARPETYGVDTSIAEAFMNEQWSDGIDAHKKEFEMRLLFNEYSDVRRRLPAWKHRKDSLRTVGYRVVGYRCGLNFLCTSQNLDTLFRPHVQIFVDTSFSIVSIKSGEFEKYRKRILK